MNETGKDISSLPLVTMQQAELGLEVSVTEALEASGVYTAERFKTRKPVHYKLCVKFLQEGITPKKISQLLIVDIRTVLAVLGELEAANAITPYKERTVWKLRAIITLALDELVQAAQAGKLSPIDVAILIDKAELLSGGATSRHEVKSSAEVDESVLFFTQAREKLASLPGMVQDAEILPPKGEPGALPESSTGEQPPTSTNGVQTNSLPAANDTDSVDLAA